MRAAGRSAEAHLRHVALAAAAAGLLTAGARPRRGGAGGRARARRPRRVGAPRAALIAALSVAVGAAGGRERVQAIDAPGRELRPGQLVRGHAHLLSAPRARAVRVQRRGTAALGPRAGRPGGRPPGPRRADPRRRRPGNRGRPRRPRARAAPSGHGGFDVRAYHRRRGIAAELEVVRLRATGRRRGGPAGAVDRASERAQDAIAHGLPPPAAALARGMVLGQDELIDEATRDEFRASGLAHVLAVSGQNVMLLAALALPMLAAAGVGHRARAGRDRGADRPVRAARRGRAVAPARGGDGRRGAGRPGSSPGRRPAGTRCCWRPA